mmetsp:Transcript_61589/g.188147  ORF Transcript_61589/g.188147 Transcript_61589/m.188147 type:complete len:217 (-) Transcript_61589:949-1599(-)
MVEEEERRAVTHLRGLRDEAGPHTVRALLDSAQRSLILQASAAMRVHQNQVLVLRERVAQPLGHGPIIVRNRPAAALLEQNAGHTLLEQLVRAPPAEDGFQRAPRLLVLHAPIAIKPKPLHEVHEVDVHFTAGGFPRSPGGLGAGWWVEVLVEDLVSLPDGVQHHGPDAVESNLEAHVVRGGHVQEHVGHGEPAQHPHASGPSGGAWAAHDEAPVE